MRWPTSCPDQREVSYVQAALSYSVKQSAATVALITWYITMYSLLQEESVQSEVRAVCGSHQQLTHLQTRHHTSPPSCRSPGSRRSCWPATPAPALPQPSAPPRLRTLSLMLSHACMQGMHVSPPLLVPLPCTSRHGSCLICHAAKPACAMCMLYAQHAGLV